MAMLDRNTYGVCMGKNLVIIGAGPGLAAAIARRFADAGFAIGLIARDDAVLAELSDQLTSDGATCFVARADVTDAEELREEIAVTVVHEIAHHFGIEEETLHDLGWG